MGWGHFGGCRATKKARTFKKISLKNCPGLCPNIQQYCWTTTCCLDRFDGTFSAKQSKSTWTIDSRRPRKTMLSPVNFDLRLQPLLLFFNLFIHQLKIMFFLYVLNAFYKQLRFFFSCQEICNCSLLFSTYSILDIYSERSKKIITNWI